MADDPRKNVGMYITSDPDLTSIEQPGADSARRVSALPLRLLLVSDLQPQAPEADWSSAPPRLFRADKNTFAEQLRALAPSLQLEVPNKVSDSPKVLDVTLTFTALDDFHPERVARQVPGLAQLLEGRALIEAVKAGRIDLDTFQARLQETGLDADRAARIYAALSAPAAPQPQAPAASQPPASAPTGSGDPLDRLLGLVDPGQSAPQEPPPEPRKEAKASPTEGIMNTLLSGLSGKAEDRPRAPRSAADTLLSELDGLLSEQLNAIFGHPGFRQLEAAWRGLKFLVDRIDFRKNIHLEVLPVDRAHVDEALYFQVLLPEHRAENEKPPLSALILDFAFSNRPEELEELEGLVETCASLQAPLVASVGPAFFGVSQYAGFAKLPPLWQQFERPEYIAWNKLRAKQEARYLALALPAFVLRYPYGKNLPVQAFSFTETDALWGNASLAVAVRIADSFAGTGWPTHLVGSSDRRIGDLPLWQSDQGRIPLATLIPDAKLAEFAKGGFVVLGGKPNHDAIYVARAQTIALPESYEDLMAATEARVHVTLPCQLFVARAAHLVLSLQNSLEPGTTVQQTQQEIEKRLRAFLHTEGQAVPKEAVEVEQVTEASLQSHDLFAIRLRPPTFVLDRPVSLVMGMQLPKTVSQ